VRSGWILAALVVVALAGLRCGSDESACQKAGGVCVSGPTNMTSVVGCADDDYACPADPTYGPQDCVIAPAILCNPHTTAFTQCSTTSGAGCKTMGLCTIGPAAPVTNAQYATACSCYECCEPCPGGSVTDAGGE
jgi:hypothetical protein